MESEYSQEEKKESKREKRDEREREREREVSDFPPRVVRTLQAWRLRTVLPQLFQLYTARSHWEGRRWRWRSSGRPPEEWKSSRRALAAVDLQCLASNINLKSAWRSRDETEEVIEHGEGTYTNNYDDNDDQS